MHKSMSPHGDYDDMWKGVNLIENFKVEKVIFNCGLYNNLEKSKIYRTDQDESIILKN